MNELGKEQRPSSGWTHDSPELRVLAVKGLRLEIKRAAEGVAEYERRLGASRESSLALTRLQEAGMWLGMELRRLADGVSCYASGDDPSTTEIQPADEGAPVVGR